jgi:hypothetical protein
MSIHIDTVNPAYALSKVALLIANVLNTLAPPPQPTSTPSPQARRPLSPSRPKDRL